MYFEDGNFFEGQWENDLQNGEGTMLRQDKSTFKANFLNGKIKHVS
jgi:hypothetical protein